MKKRKITLEKFNLILYWSVVVSFIIPIVFLVFRMVTGKVPANAVGYHSDADYALMILQCLLGLIVINIPSMLTRRFHLKIPMALYGMYIIFLYCAIFLGEVRSFYYLFPYWDSILHAFSSLMLGFLGFMLVTTLNREAHVYMHLSPVFVAVFAFSFALSEGVLWEFYEFFCDGAFGMNMQKYMTASGVILTGHNALRDTMKDLIIDALGAFVSSAAGYLVLKKEKTRAVSNDTE